MIHYLNNWISQVWVLTVDFLMLNAIRRHPQIMKEPEPCIIRPSGVNIIVCTQPASIQSISAEAQLLSEVSQCLRGGQLSFRGRLPDL